MSKPVKLIVNTLKAFILPAVVFVIILILTTFIGTGQFASGSSLLSIFRNTLLGSCISLAMACNLMCHRWDFSIGYMIILVPTIATPIMDKLNWGIPGVLICCLVIGLAAGLLNGLAYIVVRVPAIVTSLGLMIIYESIVTVYNGGAGAKANDSSVLVLAKYPYVIIVAGIAIAIFFFLFTYTRFGYNVRSLAGNQSLAVSSGINERRNVIGCYLLMGFFVAVASIIYLTMTGTITADMRQNGSTTLMYEAIPPVFIGFFLMKYTNLTWGVMLGTLTMKILSAGMLAMGVPATAQNIVTGLFLLAFIAFSSNLPGFNKKARAVKRCAEIKSLAAAAKV